MFGFLRTPFERNQQPTSRQASRCRGRICLEELESRSLPSASPAQLMADIKAEMAAVTADVHGILIPDASLTVRLDIGHLLKDVNTINADLKAGTDPTAEVNVAISADAQLKTDMGSKYAKWIVNKVQDIGNRLEVVASDLSQIHAATPVSASSSAKP